MNIYIYIQRERERCIYIFILSRHRNHFVSLIPSTSVRELLKNPSDSTRIGKNTWCQVLETKYLAQILCTKYFQELLNINRLENSQIQLRLGNNMPNQRECFHSLQLGTKQREFFHSLQLGTTLGKAGSLRLKGIPVILFLYFSTVQFLHYICYQECQFLQHEIQEIEIFTITRS